MLKWFNNQSRIPKIIHYVWVGGAISPEDKKYILGWRKLNKEYKFIFWDESNIDFTEPYIKKAYEERKWANVSNLVRLEAVYKYGGIYLDTDVELIKSLDILLNNKCFFGFQISKKIEDWVNNAVFGAVKKHWFIKDCIDRLKSEYDGLEQANYSSPRLITDVLIKNGLNEYSKRGAMVKDVMVYPVEWFYPYDWEHEYDEKFIKSETMAIHHWRMRWLEK